MVNVAHFHHQGVTTSPSLDTYLVHEIRIRTLRNCWAKLPFHHTTSFLSCCCESCKDNTRTQRTALPSTTTLTTTKVAARKEVAGYTNICSESGRSSDQGAAERDTATFSLTPSANCCAATSGSAGRSAAPGANTAGSLPVPFCPASIICGMRP